MKKQRKDLQKIQLILEHLMDGKTLSIKYKDHPLKGIWNGSRDCHIEPDCILIYTIKKDHIRFERKSQRNI